MAAEAAQMKRSLRLVLATAALVVLLAVYLLLSRNDAAGTASGELSQAGDADSPTQADDSAPAVLMEIDRDQVQSVELIGENRRLTLRRREVPRASAEGGDAQDGAEAETETHVRYVPDYPVEIDLRDDAVDRVVRNARSLRARRTIAEDAEDLAGYELDDESAAVVRVTTREGGAREVLIGRKLPSGQGYYARRPGNRTVYALSTGNAEPLLWSLADIRDRSLPRIEPGQVERMQLITPNARIQTLPVDREEEPILAMFSNQKLTEPYRIERPASPDGLSTYFQDLPSFEIVRFVDDQAEDLGAYGLANPHFELDVSDATGSRLHLLFGNPADTTGGNTTTADTASGDARGLYAKRPNEPSVFVVNVDAETLTEDAFTFVSKFVLIVDIRNVQSFTVLAHEMGESFRGRIEPSPAESAGTGNDGQEPVETFYFEGVEADEDPFRDLYQAVIGLTFDAERPEAVAGTPPPEERVLTLRYQVEKLPNSELVAHLTNYDRNFYAVHRDGVSEFLISKAQVREMIERLRRARDQIADTADGGSN